MANSDPSTESLPTPRLRSLNSSVSCKLHFLNVSKRDAQVIWISYTGKEVKYADLAPRAAFVLNTFVTHPWICRDKQRGNLMLFDTFRIKRENYVANGPNRTFNHKMASSQRIFFPLSHEQNELLHISITDGVYSLHDLCFQTLCDLKVSNICRNGIPRLLSNEYEEYKNGQKTDQFLPKHGE